MLLMGLAIGRWWAVPLGSLGWVLLVVIAVPISAGDIPLAAALGAANVVIGLVARWAIDWTIRRLLGIVRLLRAA
jgi:hypothetical protein